jgi:hypothetical protein
LENSGQQQGGNKMLQKSSLYLLGLLFATTLPAQQAQAALFVPTGGGMQVSAAGATIEGTGVQGSANITFTPFSFVVGPIAAVTDPLGDGALRARLEVTVEPEPFTVTPPSSLDKVNVSGSTTAIGMGSNASGSGQLSFDLTAPIPLRFLFSSGPLGLPNGESSVRLFQDTLAGPQLLECRGSEISSFCSLGMSSPPGSPEGPQQGLLTLATGHYELLFSVSTSIAVGSTPPENFSFSLTPVPVPAGIWLLGSVLAGLASFVRRKAA